MGVKSSLVSVDVVALRQRQGPPQVGVAPRAHGPFQGRLALPGVLLGDGERLVQAARRALVGKLGVADGQIRGIGQLVTFDEPSRDPRGHTLSLAMWAVLDPAAEGAGGACWFGFDEVPELAFDHNRIVADARQLLAARIWRDLAFTRALTGEQFTATTAVELTGALTAAPVHRANLNRQLASTPGLARADEVRQVRQTGRPAAVWQWQDPATPAPPV